MIANINSIGDIKSKKNPIQFKMSHKYKRT